MDAVCDRATVTFFVLVVLLAGLLRGQGTGFIVGTVTGEQGPLAGVQVWLEGYDVGAVTDGQGTYRLGPLAEGSYTVIASHIGYEQVRREEVTVTEGSTRVLDFRLQPVALEMAGILVTPKQEEFDPRGVTARLTSRMIQEAPGAGQDIFLVLQTLPGVASGGDDSKLYIRGGRPEENLILYDGAVIRNPFHFDFSGGGFYTIFNSSLVENVELYAGGFPARYGDRLSAVMVIENRAGNRERSGLELSLSSADFKALWEFPIRSSATTILTLRRSYFDLLLGATDLAGEYDLLPYFYDVTSKTDISLSERHRLTVNFLYSEEKMRGEFDEPHWEGTHSWSSRNWTTGLRLRSLVTPHLVSDLNLYWSEGWRRANHADGRGIENIDAGEIALKQDLALFLSDHEFHFGYWLVQDRGSLELELPVDLAYNFEAMYVDVTGNALKLAAYFEDTWRMHPRWSLNIGWRWDHVVPSSESLLSPRVNLVFTPAFPIQVFLNYGRYTQSPPGYELRQNPNQRSRQAQSLGIGVSSQAAGNTYWSLEAYRKQFSQLVTLDSTGRYSDDGYGRTSGVELYLRHKAGQRFIGWGAFTYSVARRKEFTARQITLFDYDQTYMVTLVAQYRLSARWSVSARFRYATGRPYTPAEGGWWNAAAGRFYPIVGRRNSLRYPAYHRLDLRIARYFPNVHRGLTIYFETINTYNRDNVVYYIWNDDFTATQAFTMFPFLPIIGFDLKL
jgi:hypothetical protein